MTWTVISTGRDRLGPYPVLVRQLRGHVDNSAYPLLQVNIGLTLVMPAHASRKVPVLIMFSRSPLPRTQPKPEELAKINATLKSVLAKNDAALRAVFARNPDYGPVPPSPFSPDLPNADGDPPSTQELIAAGWGFASLNPVSVQADNGAGLTRGIIGLVNHGQPRRPDQWGALRAWAWGASRALDYLQTDPAVDGKRVGIKGVSRFGKAALVTMAFDQRFAMVAVRPPAIAPAPAGRCSRGFDCRQRMPALLVASPSCREWWALREKAERRCCGVTGAKPSPVWRPASLTGWPATS